MLNKILEKSGSENIQEVWPNLELYMHGGVNFSPYKNQFEKLITKENMNYLEGYNVSEGFFWNSGSETGKGLAINVRLWNIL